MLRGILIFLLALIIAFGSTIGLYKDEVKDMAGMIQDQINGVEKPDGPSEPGDDDELEAVSIALDTTAAKTVYDFGEEFTTEGLIITVTFSDGSVKEVSPDDCRITKADTTKAGTRQVVVAYGGIVARYEVTVNAKEYAPISSTPLVDIIGKNDSVPYRVEAENIDMVTPGVEKAEGFDSFVATAPAGAAITSGEQYLTGFGVKWNYFGFTFTSTEKQEGVILVLRVANSTGNQIDAGAVKMYLNLAIDEDGNTTGALPLDGYIIPADGACGWTDIVIRNVTIPEGTNTLTFEVQNDKVFDIDYVDFYVGMRYINSVVEIVDTTTIIKDLEALDTEKAFTRQDVADAHGLKPGQLFVEATNKLPEGKTTNNGTSVGAIGKGSQMSTTIRLAEDATVLIKFKASAVGKGAYYVKDNWNFYIDGVKLSTVQEINIEGGNAADGVWWDWIYTDIGAINLSAGDHFFLLEVHGTDCNVDTVEFEVISLGSFDESGKNLEDMKQPDAPDADLVINGEGEYKFEAEDLDISNLTPSDGQTAAGIETPSGSGPATSGGKSIGMAGGGYVTLNVKLESKATIQIYATLAFAHGGNAAEFMSAAIGEIQLPANGTLPAGEGNMPYWNWAEIPMGGPVELEAGDYAITFNFLKNPNFDCIKIKVISDDEPVEEQFKLTVEAEDFTAVDVKTRQDFIDIGKLQAGEYGTEVGNGETCIMGFLEGSVFSFDVTLDRAMDLELFLVGATDAANYDVATKLSLSLNGNPLTLSSGSLTGSGATPYWDWKTVSLCTGTLEAGTYTFTLTVLEGHPNLEKVFFVEAAGEPTPPPAHSCESVCPECGKCLDAECGESACADKCQGHAPVVTPDITISDASDSYKVEAEQLDLSTLVPQAGFEKPAIENFAGGQGLGGIAGGYQTFVVTTEKDVTVALKIAFAKYEGGSILSFVSGVSVNGEPLVLTDGQVAPGTPENQWWNVSNVQVATIDLVAGQTYTFQVGVNCGNLDGYVLEVVQPTVVPDITISDASDSYKAEAEQLDLSTLVPQAGFEKPAIENFAGGQGLGGIAGGYQTFVVTTEKDVTVALKIAFAKYEGGSILSFVSGVSVNGEPLVLTDGQVAPGTPENQWWNVSNVQVATIDLVAGQTYTFQVSVNSGNLDGYVLEVVTAPAHECESICPACGKCLDSECGETACTDKCQGHHVDANISASDVSVTLEAENWYYADDAIVTRSDFVPSIGEGNLKSESGNGATCIFAFTAGSKFVINVEAASDMVVDLLLRGATDAQGYDVATKFAVTLNGQAVNGGFGSLTGSGATPYWDWQTTGLGRLNLVKGVNEITITVLDGHPNIDMIRLVPVKADVTVAASGSTVLHMENFDEHKSVIDSKDDFVAAYAGQGFKEGDVFKNPGLGRIYGFNASTFVMHVEVTEACTLNISVNLWNCNALNTYKYYFNGQAISCTNETAPGAAGTYEIGSVTVSEAGVYTFVFTTGGVDFDEVIFTVE